MPHASGFRISFFALSLLLATVSFACQSASDDEKPKEGEVVTSEPTAKPASKPAGDDKAIPDVDLSPDGMGIATFAGGCFWCVEPPFEAIDGVSAVYSGYTAGPEVSPTYNKQVARGETGHTEAIRVVYDKEKVSYELLLKVFWRNIEPTQVNGQFVDHGTQYRTGIYPHDAAQKTQAEASKKELMESDKFEKAIAVEIVDAGPFYAAETYHQDFYLKSPAHYGRYRSGRLAL